MPLATQYFKAREARRQVLIACRMKSATGWGDVCIHNISSRGMMIASDAALFPGAYIEIRRGQQTVIGRVVWQRERFSGVRTQDAIDIDALLREPRLQQAPSQGSGGDRRRDADRQPLPKPANDRIAIEIDAARRIERSQAISSRLQFSALCLFGLVAAIAIAMQVAQMLGNPAQRLDAALSMDKPEAAALVN
ncbi:MAG: PilZ domain-containing protein [Sphingomonas pseudosanguinis]|uniref:PilZ domain-containing protein n=1 Tax=Sphingomonas pseudosanguinis TaxID=413712 RepID=UPI00391D62B3